MAKRKTAKKRPVKNRKKLLFIPYPLVIFLMLCVGVYLIAWTFNAHADDIVVKAIIKGKPITDPAVITSPAEGTHFIAVPITVDGTCPANAAYVEIFRNGVMGGSAICSGTSTFELQMDLFAGPNKLEAHVFNITDDEGPVSAPINVIYDVPPAPSQPGLQTSPRPSSKNRSPLQLKTAFIYKGYYVGQEVAWPLEISGGAAPYALSVDWGDGRTSILSRKDAGQFDINHTYNNPGGFNGSYTIKVQASDGDGSYSYLEFFVIVNSRTSAGISNNIYSKGPPTLGGLHEWVWLAWPVYLAVLLMVVAYKLGEREEFLVLRKKHQLKGS
jgi:hypothetical protein